eukprot:7318800-Prymnesium_polylepis.1
MPSRVARTCSLPAGRLRGLSPATLSAQHHDTLDHPSVWPAVSLYTHIWCRPLARSCCGHIDPFVRMQPTSHAFSQLPLASDCTRRLQALRACRLKWAQRLQTA